MVIGDSVSDIDGSGRRGYGKGRWGRKYHAVWTRQLSMQIDPWRWGKSERGGAGDRKYKRYRKFDLLEGGQNGGLDFAVSGSSSTQNLERLKSGLTTVVPGVVILAGHPSPDFAHKITVGQARQNMTDMIKLARQKGSKVLLIGYPYANQNVNTRPGRKKYTNDYNAMLRDVATKHKVPFVEDFYAPLRVNGVVPDRFFEGKPGVYVHLKPNRIAEKKILDNIMKELKPLLDSVAPVVLDLQGNGLDFMSLGRSGARFDANGDGKRDHVAWMGKGMGLLAYDKQGDGQITGTDEISFVSYKPGARTDLEGLQAFDTNGDGQFSSSDKDWKKFVVWIDRNGDGVSDAGELKALSDLGIASISLISDNKHERRDGVTIHGTTTFTTVDGVKRAVGDVSFDYVSSSHGARTSALVHTLRAAIAAGGKKNAGNIEYRQLFNEAKAFFGRPA